MPAPFLMLAPFLLGAGELSMIQTMDPDLLSWWFWLLAALFAFSARVSNQMFVSALADPENARVEVAPAAGLAERWASFIAAGVIATWGGAVWFAGAEGLVEIVGLVLANGLLFGQGMLIQHYWRQWMGGLPPS